MKSKKTIEQLTNDSLLTDVSMLYILKAREHYKGCARFGRYFPTTIAQIKYFRQKGVCLDVLGMPDAEKIAEIYSKAGKTAMFQYTNSRQWCRLVNNYELWDIMLNAAQSDK